MDLNVAPGACVLHYLRAVASSYEREGGCIFWRMLSCLSKVAATAARLLATRSSPAAQEAVRQLKTTTKAAASATLSQVPQYKAQGSATRRTILSNFKPSSFVVAFLGSSSSSPRHLT